MPLRGPPGELFGVILGPFWKGAQGPCVPLQGPCIPLRPLLRSMCNPTRALCTLARRPCVPFAHKAACVTKLTYVIPLQGGPFSGPCVLTRSPWGNMSPPGIEPGSHRWQRCIFYHKPTDACVQSKLMVMLQSRFCNRAYVTCPSAALE